MNAQFVSDNTAKFLAGGYLNSEKRFLEFGEKTDVFFDIVENRFVSITGMGDVEVIDGEDVDINVHEAVDRFFGEAISL